MAEDDSNATPDGSAGSPLRALVGLGLIVVLVLGVLFVVQQLRHAAVLQDCVASGRSNCAPISSSRS